MQEVRADIRGKELAAFRISAAELLGYRDEAIARAVSAGVLIEVRDDDQAVPQPSRVARYLNVTKRLVSQSEHGEKRPHGASLKLLALVARNGLDGVA